jgi:hypothetical protein
VLYRVIGSVNWGLVIVNGGLAEDSPTGERDFWRRASDMRGEYGKRGCDGLLAVAMVEVKDRGVGSGQGFGHSFGN